MTMPVLSSCCCLQFDKTIDMQHSVALNNYFDYINNNQQISPYHLHKCRSIKLSHASWCGLPETELALDVIAETADIISLHAGQQRLL